MTTERGLMATGGSLAGIGGIWAAVHTAAPDGVSLSAAALAIITILVVAMTGVIGGVSLLLLASKDTQIQEWKRLALGQSDATRLAVKLAAEKEQV